MSGAVERGEAEPVVEVSASLGVGHVWTRVECPAYRTMLPADCTCNPPDHPEDCRMCAAGEGSVHTYEPS